jgi:hypothetical protein
MGSIIPCLALRGVASAIANSHSLRAKVLFCKPTHSYCLERRLRAHQASTLVNSKNDRETEGYTAVTYIQ